MMQNIVIDTNIIASAFITPNGNARKIIDLAISEDATICYNETILDEYFEVLGRKKFEKYNFDENTKIEILNDIVEIGLLINPITSNTPMPDEKDRIFYDTAKAANAILITGNTKHFPKENFIMTPSNYLQTRI